MAGWVCLHRKALEGGWLKNHKLWVFWSYCLLKAAHDKYTCLVGYQQIELLPGQFVFGLNKAAEDLNMSIRSIRTCKTNLEKLGNLTSRSTSKFTIITVENWEEYQEKEVATDKQNDLEVTSKRQASDNIQQLNNLTNKDISFNKDIVPETTGTDKNCPHQVIVKLYHEILPELGKVMVWGEGRQRFLRARWKEDVTRQNLEFWKSLFKSIRSMPHLMGNNDRGWEASLDWIIKPTNFAKIIEGKYREIKRNSNKPESIADLMKRRRAKG